MSGNRGGRVHYKGSTLLIYSLPWKQYFYTSKSSVIQYPKQSYILLFLLKSMGLEEWTLFRLHWYVIPWSNISKTLLCHCFWLGSNEWVPCGLWFVMLLKLPFVQGPIENHGFEANAGFSRRGIMISGRGNIVHTKLVHCIETHAYLLPELLN